MNGHCKIEREYYIDDYKCLVVGYDRGHRCGYARLPKGHSLVGVDYNDIRNIEVHGRLTYSESSILGYNGEGDWWIGFDCSHSSDGIDKDLIIELNEERKEVLMGNLLRKNKEVRTTEYVENELKKLVKQLKNI